ncbi:MAG: ribosome-associated translation inhibitor RaiA [Anaerolineae bacterium]|nr:ribosome-associated translation inhibitor RaiA [Anaerolineae bacterium]
MEYVIKGRNLEVSDALRSYVEKRIKKLDRFLPNIDEVEVDLSIRSAKSAQDRQAAQITLRAANGLILRAEERSDDLRASFDAALDKMVRQIKRYKGKHWQSQSRPVAAVEEAVVPEEEEETTAELVRIKRFETRPMDVEEAIEQMELLGHDFFLFYNAEDEQFNVVYRRRDGGYGLLIPELA